MKLSDVAFILHRQHGDLYLVCADGGNVAHTTSASQATVFTLTIDRDGMPVITPSVRMIGLTDAELDVHEADVNKEWVRLSGCWRPLPVTMSVRLEDRK